MATSPDLAQPPSGAPDDEDFGFLLTLLDLGKRLQVIVAECATEEVRGGLRRRLVIYCRERGRPFRAPDASERPLAWLEGEQVAQRRQSSEGARAPSRPVLFFPLPQEDPEQANVLHRLNENRDNLRRDMTGALCIAGLPGTAARMQMEAQDLWSVHARTFRFSRVSSFGITADHRELAELTALLAGAYPSRGRALRAARRAGLDVSRVSFARSAQDTWFEILEQARAQSRLGELLSVASEDMGPTAAVEATRRVLEEAEAARREDQPRVAIKAAAPPLLARGAAALPARVPGGSPSPQISIARLPATGRELFGRDKELAWLDACWRDGVQVASIVGWGGVGKSALVNTWLRGMRDRGWGGAERVFGWSFYSQGTDRLTSSDEFFEVALRWFGGGERAPMSPWDKGERLAELVRQARAILILDGLEPLQWGPGVQVGRLKDQALEALIKELGAQNRGLCVLTSRLPVTELEGILGDKVQEHGLDHLDAEAGAALLRARGVKGLPEELRAASVEYEGHSLSLTLLGSYLRKAHHGDVRARDTLPPVSEKPAERMMAQYEAWFQGKPELSIMRLLGFFDRPAPQDEIAALLAEPMIAGLTEGLARLGKAGWNEAVVTLREVGLLAVAEDERLDAHPLVREHFGEQFRREQPEAWREGHRRLFEHLKNKAKEFPDTVEEMAPLYAAVVHGCLAGKHEEALAEVFIRRIRRGGENFSTSRLGAFGSESAALSAFFAPPWERLVPGLSEPAQGWVLANAGFTLRALGRLPEAADLLRLGMRRDAQSGDWKNAAAGASNLAGLLEAWGQLGETEAAARESVAYADRSGDAFERVTARTTLGSVLHLLGRWDEAAALFEEAERMQEAAQPSYPLLYSHQGFQYCDLLLDQGREADVIARATRTLGWLKETGSLLDFALNHLSLGRAHLNAARRVPADEGALNNARVRIHQALDGLRRAGVQEFLPLGLLARASLHVHTGAHEDARRDFTEALTLAARVGLRLHEADAHLGLARLALTENDRAVARDHLARARALIDVTRYHRRDAELGVLDAELRALTEKPRASAALPAASPAALTTMATAERPVDFLIVAPLEEERDALLAKLPGHRRLDPDGEDVHTYFEATVATRREDGAVYRIIVTSPVGMGSIAAEVSTARSVTRWRPEHVLVVGIAAGLAAEVDLGDVMVASSVADYAVSKVASGAPRQERWKVFRADAALLSAADTFRTGWEDLVTAQRPESDGAAGRHVGVIASGGDVIASKEVIATYRADMPSLIGVEMEGAGIAAGLHAARPRFLMIRGVSELADAESNIATRKLWRAYARDVAAAYAVGFLRSGPVRPR